MPKLRGLRTSRRKAARNEQARKVASSADRLRATFLERQEEVLSLTPKVQALGKTANLFETQLRNILRRGELPERSWLQQYIDANLNFYSTAVRQFEVADEMMQIARQHGVRTSNIEAEIARNKDMIASRKRIVELFREMKAKYAKKMDGRTYGEELLKDMAIFSGLIALAKPDQQVH